MGPCYPLRIRDCLNHINPDAWASFHSGSQLDSYPANTMAISSSHLSGAYAGLHTVLLLLAQSHSLIATLPLARPRPKPIIFDLNCNAHGDNCCCHCHLGQTTRAVERNLPRSSRFREPRSAHTAPYASGCKPSPAFRPSLRTNPKKCERPRPRP